MGLDFTKFNASEKQKKAFDSVIRAIKKANKLGLEFMGKDGNLVAYTLEAQKYMDENSFEDLMTTNETIPYLGSSLLLTSGADDYPCFVTIEDEQEYEKQFE